MHQATPAAVPPQLNGNSRSSGVSWRRRDLLRAVGGLAIAAPAAGLLTACGNGESGDDPGASVTLEFFWWGGEARAAFTEEALDLYVSRNSGLTVTRTWQGFSGYYDKLATIAGGGNAPDIFQIDDNNLAEYASRNVTLDLTPFLDSGTIDVTKHPDSLTQYGRYNGKQVAIATGENTPALVFDRTVIAELSVETPAIGWSYEKAIEWAADITAKKGGDYWGMMDPSADYKALWLWLRAQGKEFYDGTELAFTEADLVAWFQLWLDARAQGATPPADIVHEAVTGSVDKQLVVIKQATCSFMWSNQLAELQKATENDLGMTAYPGDPKAQWARASTYWAASRTTEHPEAVAELINFLVNDADAGKILGVDRGLPSNLDVRTAVSESVDNPKMKETIAFENEMAPKFGEAPPVPPKGHSGLRNTIRDIAETVTYGQQTPAAAAKQFFTEAAAALAN